MGPNDAGIMDYTGSSYQPSQQYLMGRAGQTRESRQAELRASQQEFRHIREGSGHQLGCQIDENKETRVLEI